MGMHDSPSPSLPVTIGEDKGLKLVTRETEAEPIRLTRETNKGVGIETRDDWQSTPTGTEL